MRDIAKLRILVFASCVTLALPSIVDAQCVIQPSGQTACTGFNAKPALTAADIPPGASWAQLIPFNGDVEATHYAIVNGTLQHINQVTGTYDPNPTGAKKAIQADQNIPALVRVNLNQFMGALADYVSDPTLAQNDWYDILSVYGPSGSLPQPWLTQQVINAIQSDCASNNINLPSPSAPQVVQPPTDGGTNLGNQL